MERTDTIPRAAKRKPLGFTLVELIVASSIALITFATVTPVLIYTIKREIIMSQELDMKMKADLFKSYIDKDIGSGKLVTALSSNSLQITSTHYSSAAHSESSIEYLAKQQTDSNGKVTSYEIERTANGSTKTLLEDVKSYSFNFYNFDKEITDQPDRVYFVQITASIEKNKSNMTFEKEVISPLILMRNKD